MRKLSLQWRITLMTILLIGVTCVTMKLLLCSSGVHYMDSIGESLQENENDLFEEEDLRYFKIFTDKSERLSNNTQLLCDNLIHLREAMDATLNYNLNNTMKLFTMVTIIFQPLTLIVGWYGMNFKYMPELGWKFGYLYVIVLSIVVVGVILYWFKKRKF